MPTSETEIGLALAAKERLERQITQWLEFGVLVKRYFDVKESLNKDPKSLKMVEREIVAALRLLNVK